MRLRIYRWYGALMGLERDMRAARAAEQREKPLERLDDIEQTLHHARVQLFFAHQVYAARAHRVCARAAESGRLKRASKDRASRQRPVQDLRCDTLERHEPGLFSAAHFEGCRALSARKGVRPGNGGNQ